MRKVESKAAKDSLDINRVKVWHDDTGPHRRISYLQIYHHNDPKEDDIWDGKLLSYDVTETDNHSRNIVSLPEGDWGDKYAWSWTRAPVDALGHWQFAGFYGAFEKCGRFQLDRCLARIAVVFKRMDDKNDN